MASSPTGTDVSAAALFAAHDWVASPLGPVASWSERTRGIVDLVLASPVIASVALGAARHLIYNDAAAHLYGVHHPAAFGRPLGEAFPDSYPAVAALYDRVFAGEAVRVAAQPLAITGQGEMFDAYLTPVRDADGAVVGAHMVGIEVGERIRVEAALREREADLIRVQRIGRVGGLDIDVRDGLVSRRSPEYLRMHGLGPESGQETHADWRARVHPDDVDDAERHLFDTLASDASSYDSEYRIIRPSDGAVRAIHVRAASERDEAGAATRIVGAHLDVTDQKRLQAALHVSEARQAFLLELSDALRPLADAGRIAETACRTLVMHMKASRAQFTEVSGEPRHEVGDVLAEYIGTGAPMPRRYALTAFGASLVAELRRGRSLVLADTMRDPSLSDAERQAFAAVESPAAIAVPLVKDGRLLATLAIHDVRPRAWTASDVAIAEDVAERTWAAIERARAEAARRESEQRLRTLADTAPALIWFNDPDGGNTFVNQVFVDYTGRSPEQIAGEGWQDLVDPALEGPYIAGYRAAVTERRPWRDRTRIRRADGAWHWFDNYARPLFAPDGTYLGHVGVSVDVNDVVEAERALRDSQDLQRLTVQLVPALLWSASRDGDEITLNEGWSAYTGQSRAETQNFGWLDAIHPDDLPETQAAFARAFATGEPLERRHRIHKAGDGYRWHLVRHVPLRDAKGRITRWFGAAVDVHDMRALQERQSVLVAELQHRTFNLLGMIRSMAYATVRGSPDLATFRIEFGKRIAALARVQRLLSQLRDDDRISFDEIIRGELDAVAALPEQNDRVTLSGPGGVLLRSSTVQTFAMAVHELVTNAVKYGALGQPAATLTVTWHVESDADGAPWLHLDWQERGVVLPPADRPPAGTGQGRKLIEGALPYQLRARTTYAISPDGVRCAIALPVSDRTATDPAVPEP